MYDEYTAAASVGDAGNDIGLGGANDKCSFENSAGSVTDCDGTVCTSLEIVPPGGTLEVVPPSVACCWAP